MTSTEPITTSPAGLPLRLDPSLFAPGQVTLRTLTGG